jgi:endonuclease/exonuclease/phosphatase family metal-dependent hydrolase
MTIALRAVGRHVGAPASGPLSVRSMLARPSGGFVLRARTTSFSVMTHNMALLVAPGDYLGTDREGAIVGLVADVRTRVPDVVGLCEVFADDEREHIRGDLAALYPFFREGPDEADLESDGGLLVLSRHPILAANDMIYRDCAGFDCFANKGALHVRVQPPGSPTAYDLFYSHMQNIEEDGGEGVLHAQLSALNEMIGRHADPANPVIVFGDLNMPAFAADRHAELLARLGAPVDLWVVAGNPVASGPTAIRDSNFFDDADDRPSGDERLDYVLLREGTGAVPILQGIDVLQLRHNGRLISDHLGVHARFDQVLTIGP